MRIVTSADCMAEAVQTMSRVNGTAMDVGQRGTIGVGYMTSEQGFGQVQHNPIFR